MPDQPDTIEGTYGTWKWDAIRKCYELLIPARIYPMDDGRFVTSYNDIWNTDGKDLTKFEEAELWVLGFKGDDDEG